MPVVDEARDEPGKKYESERRGEEAERTVVGIAKSRQRIPGDVISCHEHETGSAERIEGDVSTHLPIVRP
jgi:hypothetical protein